MCDVWDRDIEDPITIGDYTSTASTHYLPPIIEDRSDADDCSRSDQIIA